MKPRIDRFLPLAGTLLWCAAYWLMPLRLPLIGTAGPEEYLSAFARGSTATICFVLGSAFLFPLAVRYSLWSLRRLTTRLVEMT